jgi:hypothetical protein
MQEWVGWFEDNPKVPVAQRIADACAAFARKFDTRATYVLVNEADARVEVPGLRVQVAPNIRPNYYFVGSDA